LKKDLFQKCLPLEPYGTESKNFNERQYNIGMHFKKNLHEFYVRVQVLMVASMKFRVFWNVALLVTLKLTDVSEVITASMMMEAVQGATSQKTLNLMNAVEIC
jgi:hypothetical protein